jgi:large subunit ribosomal protein L9e
MKVIRAAQTISIPSGVSVDIASRKVTVKGLNGATLTRDFRHLPVSINKIDGGRKVEVSLYYGLSKQVACLRSVCSHIDNMITGTTKKFRYCMRLVYAHFPINATITNGGKTIEIRNFLGEKIVRTIDMLGDDTRCRKSEITKDEIIIEGSDIDLTSRSVALIHQSCLVKNKDIRKFLDGIYVSQKGAIEE